MANLQSASIREALNLGLDKDTTVLRVAGATNTLIRAIHMVDSLVAPKRFKLTGAYLRKFETQNNGFSRHALRCVGDEPIDEVSEWQVIGTVGDRIVNVIAQGVFHTHQHDRSGSYEYIFNGKPHHRPEYGGITIDDIWQESGLYKQADKANPIGIIQQNRKGKVIKRYH